MNHLDRYVLRAWLGALAADIAAQIDHVEAVSPELNSRAQVIANGLALLSWVALVLLPRVPGVTKVVTGFVVPALFAAGVGAGGKRGNRRCPDGSFPAGHPGGMESDRAHSAPAF